jgi:hypothetical protein
MAVQCEGHVVFFGDIWRHWGIDRDPTSGDYVVVHLPSLTRFTQFERKAHAHRSCEAIDGLTDWSWLAPKSERDALGPQMHEIAQCIAGVRLALRVCRGARAMSAGDLFAAHFRCERAIAAARRFISRSINATLHRSDVISFLRHRRHRLAEVDIEYCATEAMNRWLSSRANRARIPKRRSDALEDAR